MALAMVAGILLGVYVHVHWHAWVFMLACSLACAVVCLRRGELRILALPAVAMGVAACAAVYAHREFHTVADDHIVTYTGPSRQLATVEGVVASYPQVVAAASSQQFAYPRPDRMTFTLRAAALGVQGRRISVSGLVSVNVSGVDSAIRLGSYIRIVGWIGRWRAPANPGQADWAKIGRLRRLFVWMNADVDGVEQLPSDGPPWHRRLAWRMQSDAMEHFSTEEDDPHGGPLLSALVVGPRHPGLGHLNKLMARAGVAHYLSISGTHLAIFLMFIYGLCRLAAASQRRSAWIVLIVLTAYLFAAEPSAPLLRASIMAGTMCLAVICRRCYSSLNSLAAAAVILLVMDPLAIFNPGFQLSFTIVLGIILLHAPIRQWLFGRFLKVRGLRVYRNPHGARRFIEHRLADWFMSAVSVGFGAYIASLPLCAQHFGILSPYGVVLTILLAPIVAAVLVPAYLSLGVAWLMPNLARGLTGASLDAADFLAQCVSWFDRLPGLSLGLRPVGAAWVLLCYAFVAGLMLRKRLPFGRIAVGACAAVLVGLTIWTQRAASPPDVARFDLLAVGHGQCGVLHAPAGGVYLFDCGSQTEPDLYRSLLEPYLKFRRLPSPREAFISHAHTDHYNGLADLVRTGRLRRAYMPRHFDSPSRLSLDQSAGEFLDLLRRHDVEIVHLHAGQRVTLDDRTHVDVLWPPEDSTIDDPNEDSLVLRVVCDEKSLVLPGDIAGSSQAALTGAVGISDAAVLPHHGGYLPTLRNWLEGCSPRIVMCSRQGSPRPPYSDKLEGGALYTMLRKERMLRWTSRHGCITLRFGKGVLEMRTMLNEW